MATSQKTIDQVRSILGKLDRSIDALRERRLGEGPMLAGARAGFPSVAAPIPASAAGFAQAPSYGEMLIGRSSVPAPALTGHPAGPLPRPVAPAPTPAPNRSPYGRAQPMRTPPPGE